MGKRTTKSWDKKQERRLRSYLKANGYLYICSKGSHDKYRSMPDKVYMVNHFTRKNGSKDSKATAICTIGEAKEIGKLLMEIK